MTEQNNNTQIANSDNENAGMISIHDIIQMVVVNWYWFALSIALCFGVAYYYLAKTPKTYSRTATIMVKDTRKGGDLELTAFNDLAGFQSRRNVDNELFVLKSRRLMEEVVKRLNLTVKHSVKGRLRHVDLYGQNPVEIDLIDDNDAQGFSLAVTMLDDQRASISNFRSSYTTEERQDDEITTRFGDTVRTPVGLMVVRKELHASPYYHGIPIYIDKVPLAAATSVYLGSISCDVPNKMGSVVTITARNSVAKRAADVVNTLIDVYNADAIETKRRTSIATANFIKDRLAVIGRELGEVDQNIEGIKRDNQMIDLSSDAQRSLAESSQFKRDGLSVENQINVAEFIRAYLLDGAHAGELIPMVTSVTNAAITSQITEYNSDILRREKLMENSSERSPVIQDIDNTLAAIRQAIIASLSSHISTLEIQRNAMLREQRLADQRISALPSQEKTILGIMRQQKIKEELFLYLLNKQEETQLNYAVAESNSNTIDLAYGSNSPVAPRSAMILGMSLVAGLAIPFALLFLIGALDTTIRGRRDIESNLSAPFLGDIPLHEGSSSNDVIVKETGRDSLSEAFRMLRSNMTFMNVSSENKLQTVLLTSSNPHAGKTFIALNLATTFATTGKRVIMVDLDLRRHSLSSQLGHGHDKNGISGYISGAITDIDKLITKTDIHKNLDVIFAGIQPPNPTEMLLSERLDILIKELRGRYDYIFMDSTPALMVADAIITDRLADLCMYVLREGVFDRRQLPDIERLYREKKLKNMSVVLNCSHSKRLGYGGYGYRYGYYGYGYHGYGYGEDLQPISYRQRIMKYFKDLRGKNKKKK